MGLTAGPYPVEADATLSSVSCFAPLSLNESFFSDTKEYPEKSKLSFPLSFLATDLYLYVLMKYSRKLYIYGFCFLSELMETASGIVSMRPPVGQVAIILKGFNQSFNLCASKMYWNFLISWDANYSWVKLSGRLTIRDTRP